MSTTNQLAPMLIAEHERQQRSLTHVEYKVEDEIEDFVNNPDAAMDLIAEVQHEVENWHKRESRRHYKPYQPSPTSRSEAMFGIPDGEHRKLFFFDIEKGKWVHSIVKLFSVGSEGSLVTEYQVGKKYRPNGKLYKSPQRIAEKEVFVSVHHKLESAGTAPMTPLELANLAVASRLYLELVKSEAEPYLLWG